MIKRDRDIDKDISHKIKKDKMMPKHMAFYVTRGTTKAEKQVL